MVIRDYERVMEGLVNNEGDGDFTCSTSKTVQMWSVCRCHPTDFNKSQATISGLSPLVCHVFVLHICEHLCRDDGTNTAAYFVIFRLDMLPIGTAVRLSNSIFPCCLCHPLSSVPPGRHTFVNPSVFMSSRTKGWGREGERRRERETEGWWRESEILYLLQLNCSVLSVDEIMISPSLKPENAASGC